MSTRSSSDAAPQSPHSQSQPSTVRRALRLWTFSASFTPVTLGATLCYRAQGDFSVSIFLLSVGAVLAVNGAGNMVNSYFDCMRKLDSIKCPPRQQEEKNHTGGSGVKQEAGPGGHLRQRRAVGFTEQDNDHSVNWNEILSQHQFDQSALVNYAAYLYFFGMLCMLALMTLSTAKNVFIAALFFGGLSSSFVYTGGIGLKYYILGDLLVVFTFGPLSMLFSYGVQSGEFPLGPLILALPSALSTEAILHSKHLREAEEDGKEGVISLAVLLGKQGSYFLFTILLFLPYLLFAVFATQYSLLLGLPLLTMPYAFQLERTLREDGPSKAISVRAAQLNVAISSLFIVGCLLARDIPFINGQSIS